MSEREGKALTAEEERQRCPAPRWWCHLFHDHVHFVYGLRTLDAEGQEVPFGGRDMTDRPSDLDTVREALEHDSRQDRFYRASTEALDRIEAVVKAARDVRYDVMNEGFLSQATSDQVHAAPRGPRLPGGENTVSASGTRDSLRHALGAALERAERAEAAAEEAREQLESVRAQRDAAGDREEWYKRDLAEARQERERFETLALTNARAADRNAARIQTLEAALRRIADWDSKHLQVPEPGFPAQIALQMQDEARAALQPTTDP